MHLAHSVLSNIKRFEFFVLSARKNTSTSMPTWKGKTFNLLNPLLYKLMSNLVRCQLWFPVKTQLSFFMQKRPISSWHPLTFFEQTKPETRSRNLTCQSGSEVTLLFSLPTIGLIKAICGCHRYAFKFRCQQRKSWIRLNRKTILMARDH